MANKTTIIDSADEAEDADYYVCSRADGPSYFTDDLYDFCCKCGEKVRHRPHGPTVPKKICLQCVAPQMEKEAKKGELEITMTTKTAHEAANFLRKKQ